MRVLAVAALVCASSVTAAAQTPDDVERAKVVFLEGRELLTSKQTQAACEKFEEAIALDPTAPGVMLNLGLCYELLERYATSLYWFRKAQVAAAEAHLPAYEDEAKRHTIALATKVSIVKLDTSALPDDAEVRIDGKLIAPTDYARIEVDRGSHDLAVRANGKQPYEREVEVTGTDAITIRIPALADEEEEVTVDMTEPPVDTPPSTIGRKIVAASFGAAGLGVCIGSPLWARHTKREYDAAVANGEMPSYSVARTKQHVATVMFVAGLGMIGFGTYLYLTIPAATVAPVIDGQQVGVAISGEL